MKSIRVLLDGLIDYAGLFPPAGLEMGQAVLNFAGYLSGGDSWVLGRFVIPVSRLDEFEKAAAPFLTGRSAGRPWRLTALSGGGLEADAHAIFEFNSRQERLGGRCAARIDTVEIKAACAGEIAGAVKSLHPSLQAYFEIPGSIDPAPFVAEIARAGARAKVRTGGMTPESIPLPEDLERFIRACSRAKVAFKATAGLHHALRSRRPLAADAAAQISTMHGFLNLFLAAAFIRSGLDPGPAVELLEEESAGAFRFSEEGVSWRDYRICADDLEITRRSLAVSFGSCSFEEPLEELKQLRLPPFSDESP